MNRGGRPKFQLVHSIWDNDDDEDDGYQDHHDGLMIASVLS